ncbi:hypothetical protein M422DRAFT_777715 [Sphaerobolus stellatus SS14]|nr:hypothetical protein M422DRAFT_777715 [Sphaerobolus stellatus SS14]
MTAIYHRFLRYRVSPESQSLIGIVNQDETQVTAILNPATGSPYSDFFHLIEDHPVVSSDYTFQLVSGSERDISNVEKLVPLTGGGILACHVANNYDGDHSKDFTQSGLLASNGKKDQPEFPEFFTKRSSIIPDGHPIPLYLGISSSVEYGGELGIIIGKGGTQIKKDNAWGHVWGGVILNNVIIRQQQLNHKFDIGKSLNIFSHMGSYVIPSSTLMWNDLHLTTKVNGEIQHSQKLSELICDITTLIEKASMGITLQSGDVITAGTLYSKPGMATKTSLKEGDIVEVTIPPLGVLISPVVSTTAIPLALEPGRSGETQGISPDTRLLSIGVPTKYLHVEVTGPEDGHAVLFFHGLGSSLQSFKAAVEAAQLSKRSRVILFDLEGHGQSPLSSNAHSAGLSISGFAEDGKGLLDALEVKKAHVVGHSMGGLIATTFAAMYPEITKHLGPALGISNRVALMRNVDMAVLAEQFKANPGFSKKTLSSRPLVKAFVEHSLASTSQRSYILGCQAMITAPDPDFSNIQAEKVIIVAGKDDAVVPKQLIDFSENAIKGAKVLWMEDVGHWHMVEDAEGMAVIFSEYLRP